MNNNILGCVYIIKCIKNNKIYVGQTIDIKRRIWEHKHALEGSKHKNKYLQEDFNKYGIASFNVIVIKENLDRKARLLLETELIQKYGGIESKNVYNFQDNIHENIEMRKIVSEHQKGKIINPKSIEKMKKSLTNRKLSEQHKNKIKQSCKKFKGDNNPAKRPDVRMKISQKVSGKGNGMYGKRKYTQDFVENLKQDYGKLKNYKKVAQKYQIAVATIMNLIKYGETYNSSNYKH